jgi:TonB family protein
MMAAFLLMFAMQAEAVAEPPAEAARPQVSGAKWVSQPTKAQFLRAYPTQAEWNAVAGRAVLDCVFTAAGRLADCSVASEEPAGGRFGAAALKLAPYFRAVAVPAGASLEHRPISVPVTFEARLHGCLPPCGG